MESLKSISNLEELAGRLTGKRVFLRADFNVPVKNGKVRDSFRIDSTVETLRFLKDQGAVTIIASHIETQDVESPTLQPVFEYLQSKHPELTIRFCADFLHEDTVTGLLASSKPGDFILFENIRNATADGMSEKNNSQGLAEYLKKFADIYIHEAFAVSHRSHASVDALPRLFAKGDKVAGNQLHKEIVHLSRALNPERPFACVLSGAKFSTKLPLIQKYLAVSDLMLIGGALFNNIAKSLGYEVGRSLVDADVPYLDDLVKLPEFATKIFIPEQVVVKDTISGVIRTCGLADIAQLESIQDISPDSVETFMTRVAELGTRTILWNGPVGNYEDEAFTKGTLALAEGIFAYARQDRGVHAILGGGDTVAAIQKIDGNSVDARIFVSTGGGAMLEFLEKEGQLPGIISLL